ncbi:DegT/DnrJ/EryC1/StrS family aminotransferase [Leptospira yasudae]|uniref:DegT/DnrJ/EryC1/StrS family aminotransferase n=2 Tax=Leptospira yasudae TaxID=2202201 RepID=A0A6N4QXQ2_9LEPT|nr:DegT/DnrJ/EryC1/StrS family aminotransferase [Leptospira yasudae]TGL81149.1 DegT/DnrJ/EryC1/StrS family aminotransferase [Leptospira yasudae]TGL82566.1 DegT/DnrJ/EryC1/StrS family aminotransferase [Leptospira yasudae]
MMKLAINGGTPVRRKLFPEYSVIGNEEKEAANRVLDSGILSKFLGCWDPDFYGGPEIQQFEKEWAAFYNVKNAIAVNSNTSGLYAAMGAIGLEPGDEVIVSPYSMSASAVAPLIYNGIPVFADIEPDYFCIDVHSIEKKITKRTKAILVVDIFGQTYDAKRINDLAKKHNLYVIEDCAQAPYSFHQSKMAGTLGDVGIFSLNYHKHIHTGEGGVVVTDNDELAERIRLIRNHAEAVVEAKGHANLTNMLGFNFRMTELEAAIGRCQLKKLRNFVEVRQKNVDYLHNKLKEIPALELPKVRENCTHSFYLDAIKFNQSIAKVSRNQFIDAVKAELPSTKLREDEGPLIGVGYVKPLYLQPLYQNRIAYGTKHFPFDSPYCDNRPDYSKGICPITEEMFEQKLFTHELMRPGMEAVDLDDVALAFQKVWENRSELQN